MRESKVKIEELRLGNILLYGRAVVEVYELSGIDYTINGECISKYEAMTVTSDWLYSLGFRDPVENGNALRLSVSSNLEICWYRQDGALRLQAKGSGFTQLLSTRYVHQLQNLYHFLTGEDLILKKDI